MDTTFDPKTSNLMSEYVPNYMKYLKPYFWSYSSEEKLHIEFQHPAYPFYSASVAPDDEVDLDFTDSAKRVFSLDDPMTAHAYTAAMWSYVKDDENSFSPSLDEVARLLHSKYSLLELSVYDRIYVTLEQRSDSFDKQNRRYEAIVTFHPVTKKTVDFYARSVGTQTDSVPEPRTKRKREPDPYDADDDDDSPKDRVLEQKRVATGEREVLTVDDKEWDNLLDLLEPPFGSGHANE